MSPSMRGRAGACRGACGGKRQHIGRLVDAAPVAVERSDRRIIGQHDSKLGARLLTAAVAAAAIALRTQRRRRGCCVPQRRLDEDVDRRRRGRSGARRGRGHSLPSRSRCAGAGLVIGGDDPRHQLVADHVLGGESGVADAFDVGEQARSPRQAPRSGPAAGRPGSDRR